jgi:hypothetical protein
VENEKQAIGSTNNKHEIVQIDSSKKPQRGGAKTGETHPSPVRKEY